MTLPTEARDLAATAEVHDAKATPLPGPPSFDCLTDDDRRFIAAARTEWPKCAAKLREMADALEANTAILAARTERMNHYIARLERAQKVVEAAKSHKAYRDMMKHFEGIPIGDPQGMFDGLSRANKALDTALAAYDQPTSGKENT